MKRLLTKDQVQAAIEQLKSQGMKPSIHRIRALTGGSNRLIMSLRAELDSNKIGSKPNRYHNDNSNKTPRHYDNNYSNNSPQLEELEARLEATLWERLQTRLPSSSVDPSDLLEMHQLWLTAVEQIETLTQQLEELQARSTRHEQKEPGTQPAEPQSLQTILRAYFATLEQLQNLPLAHKYDVAMELFQRDFGASEVAKTLAVNRSTLHRYKTGERSRPTEPEE